MIPLKIISRTETYKSYFDKIYCPCKWDLNPWGPIHEKKLTRGRILGCNWDKRLKSFPPCYSESPLLMDLFLSPPPLPLSKSGLKLVCIVNIVNGNFKSENSQDYAQKSHRKCTFMNSASHTFYFCREWDGGGGGGGKGGGRDDTPGGNCKPDTVLRRTEEVCCVHNLLDIR